MEEGRKGVFKRQGRKFNYVFLQPTGQAEGWFHDKYVSSVHSLAPVAVVGSSPTTGRWSTVLCMASWHHGIMQRGAAGEHTACDITSLLSALLPPPIHLHLASNWQDCCCKPSFCFVAILKNSFMFRILKDVGRCVTETFYCLFMCPGRSEKTIKQFQ